MCVAGRHVYRGNYHIWHATIPCGRGPRASSVHVNIFFMVVLLPESNSTGKILSRRTDNISHSGCLVILLFCINETDVPAVVFVTMSILWLLKVISQENYITTCSNYLLLQ